MTRFLSSILAKEKSLVKTSLETLEKASGENDIDARFTSELIVSSKLKMRQLGLDPADTTATELYESLQNLVGLHDRFLVKKLGGKDEYDVKDLTPRIVKLASGIARNKVIWGIRHSVAKRLLKANPPKMLMKRLGYRSLDSMLKRETIDNLFAGAYVCESTEWVSHLKRSYCNLTASDFESRKVLINFPDNQKWQKLSESYLKKNKNNVVEVKELGSIIVLPLPVERLRGITILLSSLLLSGINEIQLYSSFFKFFQVKNNFGQIVSDALSNGFDNTANIAGLDVNWKVIHDHFMQIAKEGDTSAFEPYIQADDLETDAIEENLYKIEPALHFWFGSSCMGYPSKAGTVSFNLLDVASDYVNHLNLAQSSKYYLRNSLWDELMKRYLSEEPLHEQVYDQIDHTTEQDEFSGNLSGVVYA